MDASAILQAIHQSESNVRGDIHELNSRMLNVETTHAKQQAVIDRMQEDLDGMGNKIRKHVDERHRALRSSEEIRGKKWLTFLEFLAVVPTYWHVIFGIGGVAFGLLMFAIKHFEEIRKAVRP